MTDHEAPIPHPENERIIDSEETRRTLGATADLADTLKDIQQDWGPARNREDAPRYRDERLRQL